MFSGNIKSLSYILLLLDIIFLALAVFSFVSGWWLWGLIFLVLNLGIGLLAFRQKNKYFPDKPNFPQRKK